MMGSQDRSRLGVIPTDLQDALEMLKTKLACIAGVAGVGADRDRMKDAMFKPILMIAPPGVGKTAGIASVVSDINSRLEESGVKDSTGGIMHFDLRVLALGATEVGDLSGIPVPGKDKNGNATVQVHHSPELPVVGEIDRDGNVTSEYGVLFFDEITTAQLEQVLPAMKMSDDTRAINSYKLPPNWYVCFAGNGPENDNFIQLPTALGQRCHMLDLHLSFETDFKDYAAKHLHPLVYTFLCTHPDFWLNIDPPEAHDDGLVCAVANGSSRQWATVSSLFYMYADPSVGYERTGKKEALIPTSMERLDFTTEMKRSKAYWSIPTEVASLVGEAAAKAFTAYWECGEKLKGDVDIRTICGIPQDMVDKDGNRLSGLTLKDYVEGKADPLYVFYYLDASSHGALKKKISPVYTDSKKHKMVADMLRNTDSHKVGYNRNFNKVTNGIQEFYILISEVTTILRDLDSYFIPAYYEYNFFMTNNLKTLSAELKEKYEEVEKRYNRLASLANCIVTNFYGWVIFLATGDNIYDYNDNNVLFDSRAIGVDACFSAIVATYETFCTRVVAADYGYENEFLNDTLFDASTGSSAVPLMVTDFSFLQACFPNSVAEGVFNELILKKNLYMIDEAKLKNKWDAEFRKKYEKYV